MTRRRKRLASIAVGLIAVGISTALILNAFQSNLVFFFSPSDISSGQAPSDSTFRLGGLVERGSLKREGDGLTVHFVVTDMAEKVTVTFSGILPDMFSEGQGVVAQGRLSQDGIFIASEVLAKHDETYMPPEAADALERAGHPVRAQPPLMTH